MKIYRTRRSNINVSLADRVNRANTAKVKLFYSLHVDGFHDPAALGYSDHIFTTPSSTSIAVAKICNQEIGPLFIKYGSRNRGTRRNNFYVLRLTKMTAVLTENGFMTSPFDMALWKREQFIKELVDAHVRVLRRCERELGIDSVWIDEGHGGTSPGAVSKDGIREADLVLMLSNRIEAAMKQQSIQKEDEIGMVTKHEIVTPGRWVSRIANDNGVSMANMAIFNKHIPDLGIVHLDDIVFVAQPTKLEASYAALTRKYITKEVDSTEIDKLKEALKAETLLKLAAIAASNQYIQAGKKMLSAGTIFVEGV